MRESYRRAEARAAFWQKMGRELQSMAQARPTTPPEPNFDDVGPRNDEAVGVWVVDTRSGDRGAGGFIDFVLGLPLEDDSTPLPHAGDLVLFWRPGRHGGVVSICSMSSVTTRQVTLQLRRQHNFRMRLAVEFTFPGSPISRRAILSVLPNFSAGDRRIQHAGLLDSRQVKRLREIAAVHQRRLDAEWAIEPGSIVTRRSLHDTYGGDRSGPISRAGRRIVVFLDDDAGAGATIDTDGHLVVPLTGRTGALGQHLHVGRSVHVLSRVPARRSFRYLGEAVLVPNPVEGPSGAGPLQRTRLQRLDRRSPCGHAETRPEAPTAEGGRLQPWAQPVTPVVDSPSRAAHHDELVENLRTLVVAAGHQLLEPNGRIPSFDLAWHDAGTLVLVEVKSTHPKNEANQIRLGLGQLLSYQLVLEEQGFDVARKVLLVSAEPAPGMWSRLLHRHGCELIWDLNNAVQPGEHGA